MPTKIAVEVAHYLPKEEFVARMQGCFFERMLLRPAGNFEGVSQDWTENFCAFQCRAMGKPLTGTIVITQHRVELRGEMPQEAGILAGPIEKEFRETLLAIQ